MGQSQESTRHTRHRRAFTLVELLVAITIIGVLVSLALLAVQAARESARRSHCANNVKQLALAALVHESHQRHLPTGGWGGAWVGDADRGFGLKQPGGWAYCLMPFMELTSIHELGRGEPRLRKMSTHAARMVLSSTSFNCPSRRRATPFPVVLAWATQPFNCARVERAVRTDYAANCGDSMEPEVTGFFGPSNERVGDSKSYEWPNTNQFTGVSFLRSQISLSDIYDGTSNVYLLGEKHLSPAHYETGLSHGDDWSLYSGFQDDLYRSTHPLWPPMMDSTTIPIDEADGQFGSAHSTGWNAAMCDGSVRYVDYSLDLDIHQRTGHRDDG